MEINGSHTITFKMFSNQHHYFCDLQEYLNTYFHSFKILQEKESNTNQPTNQPPGPHKKPTNQPTTATETQQKTRTKTKQKTPNSYAESNWCSYSSLKGLYSVGPLKNLWHLTKWRNKTIYHDRSETAFTSRGAEQAAGLKSGREIIEEDMEGWLYK